MKVSLSLTCILVSSLLMSQTAVDSLPQDLIRVSEQKVIPGFASLIISNGEVKFSEGYGYANVAEGVQYTDHTLQNIGSIRKTFIGVALMKAQQMGLLNLDDPISKYLDYEIVNPRRRKEVITIRHLATHTAMLKDPDAYDRAYIFEEKINVDRSLIPEHYHDLVDLYNSNERVGLDDFIKSVYVPGGKYYSKKNFLRKKAGKKYEYSNIGAGIASRIVENASGMSFAAFTRRYIFNPIGMNSTSWSLDEVNLEKKSLPYFTYNVALPHYSLVTFADGGLITNVHDLGLYIMEMMKCYFGEGSVLSQEQTREMMKPHLAKGKDPYGIFWEISKSRRSIGHNGGDPGTITNMYFIPESRIAKISFINMLPTNEEQVEAMTKVWQAMRKYQGRI